MATCDSPCSDHVVRWRRGPSPRWAPGPQAVDGEHREREPHQDEAPPSCGRHLLVEDQHRDQELQGGRQVLQQADHAERQPPGGLLQYLAPTLQFLIAVLVFHEEMPAARWWGFVLVWLALAVLTVDGLRAGRPPGRQAPSPPHHMVRAR